MRKTFVATALIILAVGISISFLIQVQSDEEVVADEWNPITPSVLDPQNATYLAFIERAKVYSGEKFPKLNITALELNISASNPVRVRIGKIIFTELTQITGEFDLTNVIFDNSKTRFTERIQINGTDVDFLEIKNEGTKSVNISGSIKTIGETVRTLCPYLNVGTSIVLTGLALLVYGLMAKPKKRFRRV